MRVRHSTLFTVFAAVATAAMMALGPDAVAAQGSVTGQVVAATTGQPINGAQVSLEGTPIGGLTNANGRYLLTR